MTPAHFGDPRWPGAAKVIEEMGELAQAIGKLLATDGEVKHWDGTDLRDRLTEETADLSAALLFFVEHNDLNTTDWADRVARKRDLFEKWHAEHLAAEVARG